MAGIMGYLSLFITFGTPLAVVILLLWIYQINRNTQIQIDQNKKIIQLLEKEKTE